MVTSPFEAVELTTTLMAGCVVWEAELTVPVEVTKLSLGVCVSTVTFPLEMMVLSVTDGEVWALDTPVLSDPCLTTPVLNTPVPVAPVLSDPCLTTPVLNTPVPVAPVRKNPVWKVEPDARWDGAAKPFAVVFV